ncbi:MAG TPA: HYR domain-containing protein [Chryseolinea sp.]
MSDGDTFTFDTPIVNISGNLHIDIDGNGRIIIPAGVTVNVGGDVLIHNKNGQCTAANPCVFEIVVNGTANFTDDVENDAFTWVWSGAGTVVVGDKFRNTNQGCMDCGPGGCPNIQVDPSDCRDDGSDCAGNFCTQIISCNSDTTPPVITACPSNQIVNMTGTGCSEPVSWPSPTASDNCALASFSPNYPSGTVFPKGLTVVTYTATDAAGNLFACSFNITVVDNMLPVISGCPSNITVDANGSCQAVGNWTPPTFTDNCTQGTLSTTKAPGSTFSKGTTPVVYTASDAAGNVATCSFNVIVVDRAGPIFQNCPGNLAVTANSECRATVNWESPVAIDNCGPATVEGSHSPNQSFPLGKTEVVYTASDNNGNVSTCVFSVTVANESPPLILNCPNDISVKGNEMHVAVADWTAPTASASCGDVTLTSSHQPGDSFPVGITTVEYKALEAGGNEAKCLFNVIVSEMEIDIGISKVVTPDGNGMHDKWILTNIEKFPDNKVVVVDRWGGTVFAGTRYNNESMVWTGTNRKGELVPTGTYFYSVFVTFGSVTTEKTGFVELVR